MKRYYFAYGSNLNKVEMQTRCKDSVPITVGVLKDARMIFKFYADVELNIPNNNVVGAIYDISKNDLKNLNRYEGYPELYEIKDICVEGNDGSIYNCFMYVMTEKYTGYQLPIDAYLTRLEEGFTDWNIDTSILTNSVNTTRELINNRITPME